MMEQKEMDSMNQAARNKAMDRELRIISSGTSWGIVEWEGELYCRYDEVDETGMSSCSCPLTEDVDMRTGIKGIVDIAAPEVLQQIVELLRSLGGPTFAAGHK